MDDFRVGSVPSSEPYGDRHPYGSIARKRQKHHDAEDGREQDDVADDVADNVADTFEAASGEEEPSAASDENAEDYYLPSGPPEDDE
jgi:hypothetical protein